MEPQTGTPVHVGTSPPSNEDRTLALIVHLGNIVASILLPLIVYLVKKDQSRFVAFHSLQTLYLGLLVFGVTLVTCGFGGAIAAPAMIVFNVIAAIKVNGGEYGYEYPIVGKWARRSVSP